jgi:hypothetical protein
MNPKFHIEDYTNHYVFTVDPVNSVDFDDGFSIVSTVDYTKVTIYIANVQVWLETLQLWDSFSKRVATIYLPDKRRPMMPTILSDTFCSLLEKQKRFALAIEFTVDNKTGRIMGEPTYKNAMICVNRNYTYEDPHLIYNDIHYIELFNLTFKCDKTVETSNDVVAFWMIKANQYIGEFMAKKKIGIFRTFTDMSKHSEMVHIKPVEMTHLNEDTCRVINHWNTNSGKYVLFDENIPLEHTMMQPNYIHITSPIRRIVDLLNILILSNEVGIFTNPSNEMNVFLEKWRQDIEYINGSMRTIRKIQTDCYLLNYCYSKPDVLDKHYSGVIFDKVMKNDGSYHYMVYLEELKLLSRITCYNEYTNYSSCIFRLFLFENEDKTKKKIRIQMID